MLSEVKPWYSEEHKIEGWAKQDEAAALLRQVGLLDVEGEHLLHGSLTHAPDLPEAHEAWPKGIEPSMNPLN